MMCAVSVLRNHPTCFLIAKILFLAWVLVIPLLVIERLDKIIKLLGEK